MPLPDTEKLYEFISREFPDAIKEGSDKTIVDVAIRLLMTFKVVKQYCEFKCPEIDVIMKKCGEPWITNKVPRKE